MRCWSGYPVSEKSKLYLELLKQTGESTMNITANEFPQLAAKMERWVYLNDLAERIEAQGK